MRHFSTTDSLRLLAVANECWDVIYYTIRMYHLRTCSEFQFVAIGGGCNAPLHMNPAAVATAPSGFLFDDLPAGDYRVSLLAAVNFQNAVEFRSISTETYRKYASPCPAQ